MEPIINPEKKIPPSSFAVFSQNQFNLTGGFTTKNITKSALFVGQNNNNKIETKQLSTASCYSSQVYSPKGSTTGSNLLLKDNFKHQINSQHARTKSSEDQSQNLTPSSKQSNNVKLVMPPKDKDSISNLLKDEQYRLYPALKYRDYASSNDFIKFSNIREDFLSSVKKSTTRQSKFIENVSKTISLINNKDQHRVSSSSLTNRVQVDKQQYFEVQKPYFLSSRAAFTTQQRIFAEEKSKQFASQSKIENERSVTENNPNKEFQIKIRMNRTAGFAKSKESYRPAVDKKARTSCHQFFNQFDHQQGNSPKREQENKECIQDKKVIVSNSRSNSNSGNHLLEYLLVKRKNLIKSCVILSPGSSFISPSEEITRISQEGGGMSILEPSKNQKQQQQQRDKIILKVSSNIINEELEQVKKWQKITEKIITFKQNSLHFQRRNQDINQGLLLEEQNQQRFTEILNGISNDSKNCWDESVARMRFRSEFEIRVREEKFIMDILTRLKAEEEEEEEQHDRLKDEKEEINNTNHVKMHELAQFQCILDNRREQLFEIRDLIDSKLKGAAQRREKNKQAKIDEQRNKQDILNRQLEDMKSKLQDQTEVDLRISEKSNVNKKITKKIKTKSKSDYVWEQREINSEQNRLWVWPEYERKVNKVNIKENNVIAQNEEKCDVKEIEIPQKDEIIVNNEINEQNIYDENNDNKESNEVLKNYPNIKELIDMSVFNLFKDFEESQNNADQIQQQQDNKLDNKLQNDAKTLEQAQSSDQVSQKESRFITQSVEKVEQILLSEGQNQLTQVKEENITNQEDSKLVENSQLGNINDDIREQQQFSFNDSKNIDDQNKDNFILNTLNNQDTQLNQQQFHNEGINIQKKIIFNKKADNQGENHNDLIQSQYVQEGIEDNTEQQQEKQHVSKRKSRRLHKKDTTFQESTIGESKQNYFDLLEQPKNGFEHYRKEDCIAEEDSSQELSYSEQSLTDIKTQKHKNNLIQWDGESEGSLKDNYDNNLRRNFEQRDEEEQDIYSDNGSSLNQSQHDGTIHENNNKQDQQITSEISETTQNQSQRQINEIHRGQDSQVSKVVPGNDEANLGKEQNIGKHKKKGKGKNNKNMGSEIKDIKDFIPNEDDKIIEQMKSQKSMQKNEVKSQKISDILSWESEPSKKYNEIQGQNTPRIAGAFKKKNILGSMKSAAIMVASKTKQSSSIFSIKQDQQESSVRHSKTNDQSQQLQQQNSESTKNQQIIPENDQQSQILGNIKKKKPINILQKAIALTKISAPQNFNVSSEVVQKKDIQTSKNQQDNLPTYKQVMETQFPDIVKNLSDKFAQKKNQAIGFSGASLYHMLTQSFAEMDQQAVLLREEGRLSSKLLAHKITSQKSLVSQSKLAGTRSPKNAQKLSRSGTTSNELAKMFQLQDTMPLNQKRTVLEQLVQKLDVFAEAGQPNLDGLIYEQIEQELKNLKLSEGYKEDNEGAISTQAETYKPEEKTEKDGLKFSDTITLNRKTTFLRDLDQEDLDAEVLNLLAMFAKQNENKLEEKDRKLEFKRQTAKLMRVIQYKQGLSPVVNLEVQSGLSNIEQGGRRTMSQNNLNQKSKEKQQQVEDQEQDYFGIESEVAKKMNQYSIKLRRLLPLMSNTQKHQIVSAAQQIRNNAEDRQVFNGL